MREINKNIVYVKGAKRGAIYNLITGDVYSINDKACEIIDEYILDEKLSQEGEEYINLLKSNDLISKNFVIKDYKPKVQRNKLRLVWLEITQACNMKCIHCYEGDEHTTGSNLLTLTEWKKVIDQLEENNVERVVVIGGEPCLCNNLPILLEYIAEKGIKTTLFTNAYYLYENIIEEIIKYKIDVKVSLYGHTAKIHDSITGIDGSFERLINNIHTLLKNGVRVYIAVTLMRENEKYYSEIKQFVKTLGVSGIKYDVIREVVNGTQNEHLPIDKAILNMSYRKKPNFFVRKEEFDKFVNHNTCWYGKLVVCENGDVLPCVFARNVICGNVHRNTISELLLDSKLRNCWELDFSKINICMDCEYRFACKDCRPMAMACGNIFLKNYRCIYNPYNGEWENEKLERKI